MFLFTKKVDKMKRKGFTLLELLVVVLIIAIIGSIGVPLYTRSYRRSISQEMLATIKLYQDSITRYKNEKGTMPVRFSDLDVNIADAVPSNAFPDAQDAIKIKDFYYYFFPSRQAVFSSYGDLTNPEYFGFFIESNNIYCFGPAASAHTQEYCEKIMNFTPYQSTGVLAYYKQQ